MMFRYQTFLATVKNMYLNLRLFLIKGKKRTETDLISSSLQTKGELYGE